MLRIERLLGGALRVLRNFAHGLSKVFVWGALGACGHGANNATSNASSASSVYVAPNNPSAAVFQAFLHCDARFFDALERQGARINALNPALKTAAGISRIAVPDRASDEGQALTFKPTFSVNGIEFVEFIDEITQFESKSETAYYWGFNTDAPLNRVLPMVQALLPASRTLSVDGKTWARIDLFKAGQWRGVPEHALLKGKPAVLPERVLIVETHEGGGTRVVCGLQAAPLPAAVLRSLRPDVQ